MAAKNRQQFKNLIIIGAGGFGREVYIWAKQSKEYNISWKIRGFLDDNKNALDSYAYDIGIISSVGQYYPEANDLFVCAVGGPKLKKNLASIILKKGGKFTNIIHPTAVIGENVKLGTGIILCPYAVVSSDSVLGDFVSVNLHAVIGHDVKIGDWCFVGPSSSLDGGSMLGDSVFLGSNSVILPGVSVGSEARVGAGSVAFKSVKPRVTVFGVPAKEIYSNQ